MIINPIIETLGVGGLTTCAFASYGSILTIDDCLSGFYTDESLYDTSLTVTTSTSTSLLSEMMDLEKNGYNTVQAMTYLESCSNEERNELLKHEDIIGIAFGPYKSNLAFNLKESTFKESHEVGDVFIDEDDPEVVYSTTSINNDFTRRLVKSIDEIK